ncbi:MAG: bifunctional phosphoribosylaminoimidazolecarboxamide formyltransferase/IMP cyclohydrolase PurH, partial [Bacteroidia bacterium]
FEDTVKQTDDESQIIEKIDIGGISLIRAAAKNFNDVLVVPSKKYYQDAYEVLEKDMETKISDRKKFAQRAFATSMHYDTAIYKYFSEDDFPVITDKITKPNHLRYGENPHQEGVFYGDFNESFEKLNGKELSYNNIVDIDAAINLMKEFEGDKPTFAILKHTNPCGLATANTVSEAWDKALEGDPISAFGGILIANTKIDIETAKKIDTIFYEVLLATDYDDEALELLSKKKNRIVLKLKNFGNAKMIFKNALSGIIVQRIDNKMEKLEDLEVKTNTSPSSKELEDLIFANKIVKHLKSNAIAFVKNSQLIGMGCGQTSRVDACRQGIEKAQRLNLDLKGAVMSSDAFFPFPDSIEIAHKAGISSIIQPGG